MDFIRHLSISSRVPLNDYLYHMKVLSCNIGEKTPISWRGKTIYTGIYKKPIPGSIFLGKTDVQNDVVMDRKHHGGEDKACYIYGFNHYGYWQNKYPKLNFNNGIFGENITMDQFDEATIFIGDIYQLGEAIIRITDPREPCYILGIRFNDQKILKQFRDFGFSGAYTAIEKQGHVKSGDQMTLIERKQSEFSIRDIFLYRHNPPSTKEEMLSLAHNPNFSKFAYKKWPIKIG